MRRTLCAGGCLLAWAASSGPAWAADAATVPSDTSLEEVIVTSTPNLAGVVQERDSTAAFGIDKSLVDTPRSVTAISDQLLDRYDIKTVYDFTAVAAGTYTGSYFGVPGSLNVRGTIADTYFQGFQQITNIATYPTPVDASSNIELVRGPPSPAYGAGQIGGYMNLIPKSALDAGAGYLTTPTGAASFTYGSYNQKEATLEGGLPLTLGDHRAGLYGFLALVDSDSFYFGEHPQSQTAQLTFSADLGPDWKLSATTQYIHSTGYLKDLGWNRVSQNLIDHGQYLSGTALTPIVQPGQSYITYADFAAANAQAPSGIQQYVLPAYGVLAKPNQYTELNPSTVRLVTLSPRQTAISAEDINDASTPLLYIGLTRALGDGGELKLESFSQYLSALNYQSVGFATQFRTTVNEERLTYDDKRSVGDHLFLQSVIGLSYRYSHAYSAAYLNSGVNVQDRWDLSQPQTSDEVFNAVFNSDGPTGNYRWDDAITSVQNDAAVFLMEDALLFSHLDFTAAVRDDNYRLKSNDTGTLGTDGVWSSESASPVSYNLSVSVKNPYLVPYFTYARSYSLNLDQGGAVIPSLVSAHEPIGTSTLREIGVKTSLFHGRLYAAADVYDQTNQYVDVYDASIDAQRSEGFEAELRYLPTRSFGLTGTVTLQHVQQLAGGNGSGPFLIITPEQAGIAATQGYGGMFETNAKFLGLSSGYALHTTPRVATGLFATYDRNAVWGLTGGFTYDSWTGGSIPGSIRLPAYALVKVGAYATFKGARADLYVDNLLDKRYFIAEYDVDSNASVLPGIGRAIHFKLSKRF